MTSSTSCARAAAKSAVSAHGEISAASVEQQLADALAHRGAARLAGGDDVAALGAQRLGEQLGLRRLAAAVDSLEGDEHSAGGYGRGLGERTRSVESSYAPTLDAARWRTATIVACAVAALELGAAGRDRRHRPRQVGRPPRPGRGDREGRGRPADPEGDAARRTEARARGRRTCSSSTAAASPAQPERRRTGCARAATRSRASATRRSSRRSTRTLVMYRRGYRAEAARLARDAHTRIVSPLDGMRRSALMGAQVVLVVGH